MGTNVTTDLSIVPLSLKRKYSPAHMTTGKHLKADKASNMPAGQTNQGFLCH